MTFQACSDFTSFFNILPKAWQEGIVPFWENYVETTKCYVLLENNQIIAGGLVFSICPPDMIYAKEEAEKWINNNYLYVGFIYVVEEKRNQNLGSLWLNQLKKTYPKQNFWLTIEDLELDAFYVKNGFQRIKSLNNHGVEEIIYAFEG